MVTRYEILKIDQPSRCGRIYSRQLVEEILNTLSVGQHYAVMGPSDDLLIHLERIAAKIVRPTISDNALTAEIELLDTPMGRIMEEFMKEEVSVKLCLCGSGNIHDGVVSDYRYAYCYLSVD